MWQNGSDDCNKYCKFVKVHVLWKLRIFNLSAFQNNSPLKAFLGGLFNIKFDFSPSPFPSVKESIRLQTLGFHSMGVNSYFYF